MGKSKEIFNKERESEFLEDLHSPKSKLKELDLFSEIQRMIERVNEGYENELEIYCLFSDAEKAFKKAKEEILPAALIERSKYDEKTLKAYGKNISITSSGRYYFDSNEAWNKKKEELDAIQELMKSSLKAAENGECMIDEETAEVIPAAVFKPSKTSLKLG